MATTDSRPGEGLGGLDGLDDLFAEETNFDDNFNRDNPNSTTGPSRHSPIGDLDGFENLLGIDKEVQVKGPRRTVAKLDQTR
jgi:hypothetical protein